MSSSQKLICVGRIRSPHGVRGLVNLDSYTQDPMSLFEHDILRLEDGSTVSIDLRNKGSRGSFIAAVKGVENREAAQAFIGAELYIFRTELPDLDPDQSDNDDDEFYITDLIGLEARLLSGNVLGTVSRAPDFGGGVLLEIELTPSLAPSPESAEQPSHKNKTVLLPFTVHHVPDVDLEAGFVTVVLPIESEPDFETEALS